MPGWLRKVARAVGGLVVSSFAVVAEVPCLAFAVGIDVAKIIRKSDEIVEHDLKGLSPPADNVAPWSTPRRMWKAYREVFWDDIFETFFR